MNEIVVYQPNEVTRLEVRVEHNMAWLNRHQLSALFGRDIKTIGKHIANAFKEELSTERANNQVVAKFATTATDGKIYQMEYYGLEVVTSVGYRVKSPQGVAFRRWANEVLGNFLLQGAAINRREIALADEMDRRLMGHEKRLSALEDQVKLIVNAALPPPEKVFLNGEVLDAQAELTRLVKTAKCRVILIDNYIDERTLLLLGARAEKVACTIYTLKPESPKLAPALANYKIEYPTKPIEIKGFKKAHDRFLIVDDTLWHIGASLKDAGLNLFAMMKMSLSPDVILAVL